MSKFSEGYEVGLKIQTNKMSVEEYEEKLKNLLKTSTYNDCKEWYFGFHAALLKVDLTNLENAFLGLKEEAQKRKENND